MSTVIVAGSGPDSLTAAILLAKAGNEVHVLEEGAQLGGLLWGASEFSPGYRTPGLHLDMRVDHDLIRKLCPGQDLSVLRSVLPIDTPDGAVPGGLSEPSELPGWMAYREWLLSVQQGLRTVARRPAPPFAGEGSLWPLLRVGATLRWMGKGALREVLRRGPLSLQDALGEWPELGDGVRASLALTALSGTWLGPRDPTTNGLGLLRAAVADEVARDSASLLELLSKQAAASGATLHFNQRLSSISLKDGRVDGVVAGGMRRACDALLMGGSEDLLSLLPPFSTPSSVEHSWKHVRRRGNVAVVRLGLETPLERDGVVLQRIHTAGHVDQLERAHDAVKYGQLAEVTPLDVRQWSSCIAGLAPEGHHVLGIHVHGVPFDPELAKEDVMQKVGAALDSVAPGISERVVCSHVLRPCDLESEVGLRGGHLWGAEMALDQLWATRPFAAIARYKTPWRGLYAAGCSYHPGSLAHGSGGAHAARIMLGSL